MRKAELLEALGSRRLRLKKSLGQNYLIDPHVTRRAVDACELGPGDTVVEIGAGLGALTELLAPRVKRLIAVEIDHQIVELLAERLHDAPNVEVICQDILEFPWDRYPRSLVVGAIPYQITSPILVELCRSGHRIPAVWLGMQDEVARRLSATPGTKAYGRLTVLVHYRFEVKTMFKLPRQAFFPQPRVDSAWVRLTARPAPAVAVPDEALFFGVVRAAFSQRRKTLLNCLGELTQPRLSRPEAQEALGRAGIRPGVRGETLSLAAFAQLAAAIQDLKPAH